MLRATLISKISGQAKVSWYSAIISQHTGLPSPLTVKFLLPSPSHHLAFSTYPCTEIRAILPHYTLASHCEISISFATPSPRLFALSMHGNKSCAKPVIVRRTSTRGLIYSEHILITVHWTIRCLQLSARRSATLD